MAVTSLEFLKSEINGVEYFTVVATGESGLSGSGIARSLGVTREAVSKLLQKVAKTASTSDLPKSLQPLHGKGFSCQAKYKNAIVHTSEVWACFAEYYSFEARKTTEKALTVYRSFGRIGAESYIQGVTGWLPEKYVTSAEARANVLRILDKATPWERFYEKEFCDRFFSWFGSQGYWKFCYHWMTPEERLKVNEINPICFGKRPYKIHQLLPQEIKDRLEKHVSELVTIVMRSPSKQQFSATYSSWYGTGWQLEMKLQ